MKFRHFTIAVAFLSAIACQSAFAQTSINNLPAGSALYGPENIPVSQGSTTYKFTPAQINAHATSPSGTVSSRLPKQTDDLSIGYFSQASIDSVYMSTAAVGCATASTLTFNAPISGGVQATGHFVLGAGGLEYPVIDNPGLGYTSANVPTATVSGGGCSTTPVIAPNYSTIGAFWNSPYGMYQNVQAIHGAAVWNKYATASRYPIDVVAKGVSAAAVVGGGTGYVTNDTVTLSNGTVLTVTASAGVITSAVVTTPGNWNCWTTATQSPVSTSGIGTGATFTVTVQTPVAAYGMHRLTSCYMTNSVMDVVRASDSTTKTVGFDQQGYGDNLDMLDLQQFCAGTTCKVSQFYDQGGQGNNCTQGTSGSQPIIDFNHVVGNALAPYFASGDFCTISSGASAVANNQAALWLGSSLGGAAYSAPGHSTAGSVTGAGNFESTFTSSGGGRIYLSEEVDGSPSLILTSATSTTSATADYNDWEGACASACTVSSTNTGGSIGASASTQEFSAFVSWPRGLTTQERSDVKAASYSQFNFYPQVRDQIWFDGDSRTAGVNSTNQINYPYQAANDLRGLFRTINTGLSGTQSAARVSAFWTGYGAYFFATPHGANQIYSLWIGYNDLTTGNLAPSAIYANDTTLASYVHAWPNALMALDQETEGAGSGGSYTSLNTLINANTAGADLVVPLAADPVWTATYAPQTFMAAPHPTTYGYGFVALDAVTSLATILK